MSSPGMSTTELARRLRDMEPLGPMTLLDLMRLAALRIEAQETELDAWRALGGMPGSNTGKAA